MELNVNISPFRCYVRRGWFTKDDDQALDTCTAFALQSTPGKILSFHLMTDYGMLRSRVPINEILMYTGAKALPPDFCQLWDCFGYHVTVIEYDYLGEKRCEVLLKDKTMVWGTYLMTVDWHSNAYSDTGYDYKCGHLVSLDSGALLCQPNNRIFWKDMNFVTKEFPIDPRKIKVDNEPLVSVEAFSDRWVSEDTDCYYYDILNKKAAHPPTDERLGSP